MLNEVEEKCRGTDADTPELNFVKHGGAAVTLLNDLNNGIGFDTRRGMIVN